MVYLLTGSEDGVIGVYGSKKKAIIAATQYVAAGNDIRDEEVQLDKHDSFFELYANDSHWATATIDLMELQ